MQTTEINGFVIDEFNQHKLETGKKQGICPLCSHTRKPKNQKAKCASYDWVGDRDWETNPLISVVCI